MKADLKRVGIVYRLESAGGVQSCALALIRALNRQGITPDIIWDTPPSPRLLEEAQARAGFHRVKLTFSSHLLDRLPFTLRYLANIFNIIPGDLLKDSYDFFYIFYNGFLLSPGTPQVRYLSGPPLIPQLANIRPGLAGLPMRFLEGLYRRWLKHSRPAYEFHPGSTYVINAQYTARLFEQAHGVALPVVYPPIPVPDSSFSAADWPRRDTLAFFSRIIDYKRPNWVINLARLHPDLRCVIMGSVPNHRRAYFESLQAQARSLGLEQVTFLANPSNERVRAELARTRYYVFPARNEHFGMTTVEAIAAGALPFVHDSGGQREIVPFENLRFSDGEFEEKFEALTCLDSAEVKQPARGAVRAHPAVFRAVLRPQDVSLSGGIGLIWIIYLWSFHGDDVAET